MTATEDENVRSGSTTWGFRKVKISPPAASHERVAAGVHGWWALSRWNPRKNLTIKIKYRGGPECWYRIEARGREGNFRGSEYLHDVLDTIYGGERRSTDEAPDERRAIGTRAWVEPDSS